VIQKTAIAIAALSSRTVPGRSDCRTVPAINSDATICVVAITAAASTRSRAPRSGRTVARRTAVAATIRLARTKSTATGLGQQARRSQLPLCKTD